MTPDWVGEHFERLTFAAGLPPIRFHDLRHGAATLSLAAGTDTKYVSAMPVGVVGRVGLEPTTHGS